MARWPQNDTSCIYMIPRRRQEKSHDFCGAQKCRWMLISSSSHLSVIIFPPPFCAEQTQQHPQQIHPPRKRFQGTNHGFLTWAGVAKVRVPRESRVHSDETDLLTSITVQLRFLGEETASLHVTVVRYREDCNSELHHPEESGSW